ncbi:MAG: hypothetical protein ACLSFT_08025 [Ruminococcus callidus]
MAWGIVISNILALFLLGAAFIAVTLFISSLTENQVVAAVLGMIVLLALALIDVVARYAENVPVVPTVLNALSFTPDTMISLPVCLIRLACCFM